MDFRFLPGKIIRLFSEYAKRMLRQQGALDFSGEGRLGLCWGGLSDFFRNTPNECCVSRERLAFPEKAARFLLGRIIRPFSEYTKRMLRQQGALDFSGEGRLGLCWGGLSDFFRNTPNECCVSRERSTFPEKVARFLLGRIIRLFSEYTKRMLRQQGAFDFSGEGRSVFTGEDYLTFFGIQVIPNKKTPLGAGGGKIKAAFTAAKKADHCWSAFFA